MPFQTETFQSLSNFEINIFQSLFIQVVIQLHIQHPPADKTANLIVL